MEVFSHATCVSDSKMMLLCMVEDGRGGPHVSPIDESSIDIFLLALSDLVLHVEIRRLYFMAEGLNLVMTSQWLSEELVFEIFLSSILTESRLMKSIEQC